LRISERSTIERRGVERNLFRFFNRADDGVEVRPIAGIEFGMEKFSICANLKCSAARRNESERLDALAEFENFGRQTDGLGRVVSNYAVFDRYFGFHLVLLSEEKRIDGAKAGQETVEATVSAARLKMQATRLSLQQMASDTLALQSALAIARGSGRLGSGFAAWSK
jgi:hypothetical protein